MRVTLFGTRGSVAAPGAETAQYGGNTSSVQVSSDETILVLDAGTGIRRLAAQLPASIRRIDVLLTHLHMDHIQGLGFFTPLYNPGIETHIWGPASGMLSLAGRLSRYLSPPLFPVHLRDLPRVSCHQVPCPPFDIGPFRIESDLVCHPGPTVGYRIAVEDRTLCYLPDHEPALVVREGKWPEPSWISGFDLAAGADLLIHDSQYTDAEYERCIGWGHSSYRHAFEFASQVGAKHFIPFHHDPSHDDEMLDRLLDDAKKAFSPKYEISAGMEGAFFEV